MKLLIFIVISTFLLFSCKKETLTNKINGEWYFIEAFETDSFDNEYNLLDDYENTTITFSSNESFSWFEDGFNYPGSYRVGLNKLTLNFDDGDKEIWENYSLNKNKNTLSYSYYDNNNSYFEFKLKKITTNYSRR